MKSRPTGMISTFRSLTGNARACVWTEPLWGIPYNLYIPYVSLYMEALGLSKAQIGFVASFMLVVQIFSSLLGGALTDKLGRRRCTVIFDTLSWTIPALLWMFSQNFSWFVFAALFNGLDRITHTSWNLLMTEGTEPNTVVKCFSLCQFMGLLAAFFAPLSKLGVDAFGLVPTMRVLYGLTAVFMTAKFIILYFWSKESPIGLKRMEETRDTPLLSMVWDLRRVLAGVLKDKRVLLSLGVLAAYQSINILNNSFWSLMLVEGLGVAQSNVSLFVTLRQMVVLAAILLIAPRLRFDRFRRPMLWGWTLFAAAQGLLLLGRGADASVAIACLSVVLEAVALTVLAPMADSLLLINADENEKARVVGLLYAVMLIPVSVCPAIAGLLADRSLSAPFLINLGLMALGAVLTACLWRARKGEKA